MNAEGHRRLQFSGTENLFQELDKLGEMPLPPYIERTGEQAGDQERYQTVYAQAAGSVAAPTAGLHFTPELLDKIRALGVKICFVTLHVGAGTFLPVKAENIAEHTMHAERFRDRRRDGCRRQRREKIRPPRPRRRHHGDTHARKRRATERWNTQCLCG